MSSSSMTQNQLDLSDVEHRVGQQVGGGQQWASCSVTDIRRWVMAMDYANPIHWNEELARNSRFGGLVAPQSIAVALDCGESAQHGDLLAASQDGCLAQRQSLLRVGGHGDIGDAGAVHVGTGRGGNDRVGRHWQRAMRAP